ncbi:restriction endonuclease subunit S [Anaerovorax sp. IOR16]|uniref:restriction endonuclease subunit S n=1 Tax=Anaerovorax sp. IOR16 TaxID=2773458 RepID=UPI0019D071A1|nr:restriction endonuclease subunit S [Anaerovorax sp. IOR16]
MIEVIKIKDAFIFLKKSKIKAGEGLEVGKYPFYTSSSILSKYLDSYEIEGESLIFGTGGSASVHHSYGKFSTSTDCFVVQNSKKFEIDLRFVFLFLTGNIHILENGFKGAGLKHISKKYLENVEIPVPPLETQKKIVEVLDKAQGLIDARKEQIRLMDELVRSVFYEMFGDPLNGTAKWGVHKVGDIAGAIDPQPSHRTPPVSDDGIPYISIKDCDYRTGKIDFGNARKVGFNVLDEHRKRYTLHDGDFIIGKIGTIGNPIFVPIRDDYTLSANVVLVQPNRNKVSPYFLKYSFMSDFIERQFLEAKNSTSQAAFGIQKVRSIDVMNPDINIQRVFEKFAIKVGKFKSEVQNSLDEMQVLFNSIMQKYFN